MMTVRQVLDVLDMLAEARLAAWVDGGWGVEALLGAQRRAHEDLDLVVFTGNVADARTLLVDHGFTIERDWLPTALALRHPDGRSVDLHPVEPTPDGGGDQIQLDGTRWHYDPPVAGEIGGVRVLCCSVACQIAAHLGYEPDEVDRDDMRALAEQYQLTMPLPYQAS